jgi:hypothetical protein
LGELSESLYEKKLCLKMLPKGDRPPEIEEVIPLVRGARFICRNCGRVARDSENLCNPIPLGDEAETPR